MTARGSVLGAFVWAALFGVFGGPGPGVAEPAGARVLDGDGAAGGWVLGHRGVRRIAAPAGGRGRSATERDEGPSGGLTPGGERGCVRAPHRGEFL